MIDGAGLARLLAQDLSARGGIDLLRGLSGRHVCAGQKRGRKIGPTKRGKGSKIMVLGDAEGLPLAVHLEAASPAEVKLLEPTLAACALAAHCPCA